MKVTFKTLNQQTFTLDLDENDLVKDVKKQIEVAKGPDFPSSNQMLICSGKVMEEEKTVKHYKIPEKGFVVVMVANKPSADKPADPPKSTVAADTQGVSAPVATDTTTTPDVPTVQTEPPAQPPTSTDLNLGENTLVTGAEYERAIQEIVNMGFDQSEVIRAMRVSFNNPDRAVEYLLSGNAGGAGFLEPQESDTGHEAAHPEAPGDDQALSESAASENPIAALTQLPQFQQMRSLVQSNPAILPQLLQQIGLDNADLFRLIQDNQQGFLEFLNAPATESSEGEETGAPEAPATDQPQGQPRQLVVTMTPEEREAVNRLMALGFSEAMVVQAYFACEKDEDLAANFLIEHGLEDEMM